MNPARRMQQPRNALNFASCAKETTTIAKVNVAMSDKALVKHLQKEVERLESEQRTKDAHIEKLEKQIKHLILQRDIAQSHVKELLQILGDRESPLTRVGLGNYPHLRVRKSPDMEIQGKATSAWADTRSLDVDSKRGYNGSISGDHFVRAPCFNENCVCCDASHKMSRTPSYPDVGDSPNCWEGVENQNKGTLEDRCQEIHCVSAEKISNMESGFLFSEDYNGTPTVKVRVNREVHDIETASFASFQDESVMSSPSKDDTEVKELEAPGTTPTNTGQRYISPSTMEDKELIQTVNNKKDSSSFQCLFVTSLDSPLQYLSISSLGNPSLAHHRTIGSFGNGSMSLSGSEGSKTSINTNSVSQWLTAKQYRDCTPSFELGKESEGFGWKISALKFDTSVENFRREGCQPPSESALDIKIDNPVVNLSAVEDGGFTSTPDLKGEAELSSEQQTTAKPDYEVASKVSKPKKNVNDVGVDPVEDESKVITSWPIVFRRLQRQIIELWHACSISLVHRTYFFLLFQGDPSDAIYLEVEIRRLKFLKDKFSLGEKAVVNGQCQTLSSSKKALRQERQMLTKQMKKKFAEKERELLFAEWGIGLNTKMRRQQLADLVWTNPDDMNHIDNSAFLVAKLVGIIEPGRSLTKEMFGLNFSPKCGSGISTFKRSLVSIL